MKAKDLGNVLMIPVFGSVFSKTFFIILSHWDFFKEVIVKGYSIVFHMVVFSA